MPQDGVAGEGQAHAFFDSLRAPDLLRIGGCVYSDSEVQKASFLLVHGSWHGPWCFGLLINALERSGHEAWTVALPSVGGTAPEGRGLHADGAAIAAAAEAIPGPLVVVGHSYGGAALAAADLPDKVRRLVFMAAFMPDSRRTYTSYLPPGPLPPYVEMRADGTFAVPEGRARAHSFHDVPASLARWAEAQLRPQSQEVLAEAVADASWRRHPSTFVLTEDDRALPPDLQRQFLHQADEVHRLPGSHSPMLARPEELAARLDGIAARS